LSFGCIIKEALRLSLHLWIQYENPQLLNKVIWRWCWSVVFSHVIQFMALLSALFSGSHRTCPANFSPRIHTISNSCCILVFVCWCCLDQVYEQASWKRQSIYANRVWTHRQHLHSWGMCVCVCVCVCGSFLSTGLCISHTTDELATWMSTSDVASWQTWDLGLFWHDSCRYEVCPGVRVCCQVYRVCVIFISTGCMYYE